MQTTSNSTIEYIDHMGTDLSVVNSARVSFDKTSSYVQIGLKEEYDADSRLISHIPIEVLSDKDSKLISYLAKHGHWSPFAHTSITVRISAPLFVARQLVKHQVGLVWNEVSRRYVDDEPVMFIPDEWRGRPINAKQGSSGGLRDQASAKEVAMMASQYTLDAYDALLKQGVAPEQARMILPQNMMTTWFWTGSLLAFNRVFKQRTDNHAQSETKDVAKQIGVICNELFPVSWSALCNSGSGG